MHWRLERLKEQAHDWRVRNSAVGKAVIRPTRPVVSFSFDDFPANALHNGGAILESHDVRGTYYVAGGLRAGASQACGGHYSVEDLHDLIARGHELGCHTWGHTRASDVSGAEYGADVERNADELGKLIPGLAMSNFAYPYGAMTVAAKRAISQRFRSARSTLAGLNVGNVDLFQLRANKLYSDVIPMSDVTALIDRNARENGWLILYTHDVGDSPSRWGCTPEYFAQAVRAVVESDALVLPVDAALSYFGKI